MKTLSGFPSKFMPTITWSGPRYGSRDDGGVSYYQYAAPEDVERIVTLRSIIVDRFLASLTPPTNDIESRLRGFLALSTKDVPRPQWEPWLPACSQTDARNWGEFFGDSMKLWTERFSAAPETKEAWAWRVLWKR